MAVEIPEITIKDLAGMSEDRLLELFGFKEKVAKAKEEIEALDKLQGKERELAEERIREMFTPNIYPDELGWIRKDSRRQARLENTSMEELQDASPDILD